MNRHTLPGDDVGVDTAGQQCQCRSSLHKRDHDDAYCWTLLILNAPTPAAENRPSRPLYTLSIRETSSMTPSSMQHPSPFSPTLPCSPPSPISPSGESTNDSSFRVKKHRRDSGIEQFPRRISPAAMPFFVTGRCVDPCLVGSFVDPTRGNADFSRPYSRPSVTDSWSFGVMRRFFFF